MAQFLTLAEAISANVNDGDTLAVEGFTHLIPYAAGHEIIRQKKTDLTVIRMTPDLIYDQMVGMGMVRKMVFSWTGNPGVGSLHRVREAVEQGWPRPLEIEEHSHAAMANAYEAGAAGLPCAIFRGYIGVDLPKVNPRIKFIECPFTGERLAAVPAIRPDCSVIHALRADKKGNVLLEGIVGVQKEAVLSAKRSVVTVEEVVDELFDARSGAGPDATVAGRSGAGPDARGPRNANAIILPSWTVSAIAVVPGGAFPSYAHGYYKRNNAFYIAWDEISRERASFAKWMDENVLAKGPEAYARYAGKRST